VSETTKDVIHTHILIDLDDLYVLCVKTKSVDIDWVAALEDVEDSGES
tara:strand:+ start:584 stop:727 length:144 start_codon:yes stop_codon:yes gene_type:complete